MGCPVFPPGFLLGTDFLNSSMRRKSKRYCPIGTEKIKEVAYILLITVVQYMLPHSQPVKSYTITANSVRNDPALPYPFSYPYPFVSGNFYPSVYIILRRLNERGMPSFNSIEDAGTGGTGILSRRPDGSKERT